MGKVYREEFSVSTHTGPLLIRVSPKNVDRSLRIFDTLIKVFRARGHEFGQSTLTIGEEKYVISIREKLKKIENDYKKLPTGDLCLKVYSSWPRFEIYDSKNVLIEEKIARIVAKIELDAKYWKDVQDRNEKQRAVEKEAERIRQEYQAKKENELEAFKQLLSSAKQQFETKLIRNYIQSAEEKAKKDEVMAEELKHWVSWARDKADWYDPHIEKEDELLKEVDRVTLTFRK